MQPKKKSNHYVPKFYMKNFSNNLKSIGLYLVNKKKYCKDASIRDQACKDYLYGEEDTTVEDLLMNIEGESAEVIKNIITKTSLPSLDSKEYQMLLLFMLISEARSLRTADSQNNLIDTQMRTILKMDKNIDIPESQIDNYKVSLKIPNLASIRVAFEIYPILFDLKCTILINKTDRMFITTDNPLVKYNLMYVQRQYTLRGYGLGNMGIQLFLPISPKLCICVFDQYVYDYSCNGYGNIEIHKGRHIDELNRLFYLNSYETLFFNNLVSEKYINRLISEGRNINIENEVATFGEQYNKLIAYSPRKVTERINLSFFKMRKEFFQMPLPMHMAGPMRPYAKKFSDELSKKKSD